MLKFMKHQQKLTPERIQKQKELFAFNKACYHGFPAKPSALAWDPLLRLLGIATKTGHIRIYGSPGVEVYGHNENSDSAITHITFLPGQCRLVTLCEDNSLHLWQLSQQPDSGGMQLKQIKSTSLEGKLKKISVVVADSECHHLLVGTEGGNIYLLDLTTFNMSDNIIYQDVVMQNVPEDYKVNPGPVEAIAPHPTSPDKLLIGYQRGLIVLWDKKNLCADQTYVCTQQLESLCWQPDASQFTSCHNDGSYLVWSSRDSGNPTHGPQTVYGPFPCKPITKILTPPAKEGDDLLVFSGGMPRASYGDRNTVTVMQGDQRHVTFSLTSKVLDFTVITHEEAGHATCLVVLAEEEAVFIDLESEDWPPLAAPYLASLHSSAITCSLLASNVTPEVYNKIKDAGSKQHSRFSSLAWPINGGKLDSSDTSKQLDILLTGHEDGTVQFWDASGVSLTLLYKFSTAPLFHSEDLGGEGAAAEDDDWPPFRKAGLFDPYSDDPRLGVKKVSLCPYTGTMAVAGTAGQVLLMALSTEAKEFVPECTEVNLVMETDNFVWKSHSKLDRRSDPVKFDIGMQPTSMVQFYPPAACTSLTLHSEWGLMACGTAHGFALYDIVQKKNILAKSTLSPLDLANAADEGPMSRRKSLKKSLRESFRRLRRGRSRKTGRPGATSPPSQPQSVEHEIVSDTSEESHEEEPSSPDEQDDYDLGVGEEVFDVSEEEEEEEEDEDEDEGGVEGQVEEEEGRRKSGRGGGREEGAPLSTPENVNLSQDDIIEEADDDEDDEDIVIEEQRIEGEDDDKEGGGRRRSKKKKKARDESEEPSLMEPVPFLYYVTPKRFRASTKKQEAIILSEKDPESPKELTATSPTSSLKASFERFREWMHRDTSEGTMKDDEGAETEERAKVEGVEPSESKEGSLRRLFRRAQTPTRDRSPLSESKATPSQSPVLESILSRRQKLRLAFSQRPAVSEEGTRSESDQPAGEDKEPQPKQLAFKRPRRLWTRSQSERKASPDQGTVSSPETPSTEPLGITPDKEKHKRSFHHYFASFRRRQEGEETQKKTGKEKVAVEEAKTETKAESKPKLEAKPEPEQGPSTEPTTEELPKEPTGDKLKRFLRQSSEVILRPFSKRGQEGKRISAPPATLDIEEMTLEVSDIEARHPSISTYIDETPTVPAAPQVPLASSSAPSSQSVDPPPSSAAPPSPAAPPPPTTAPPPLSSESPIPSLAPPAPSSEPLNPTLPLSGPSSAPPSPSLYSKPALDVPQSPSSERGSLVLDLHSLRSTPEIARKVVSSHASALTRRLTFTLPFTSTGGGGGDMDEAVKPVERAIEARSQASDYIGSMVRCLHLTKCFIANSQNMSATLWAGTNSGAIYVFTVAVPLSEKRSEVPLTVQLGKEIHLKHGAPVISICILDGASRPFPPPMAVKKEAAPPPNPALPHRVLICSEEQFKVFTLPQLKPFCKFKLTAHEGSRARKIEYADFVSSVDATYREPSFLVITNMGDFSVFSLPDCRRQIIEPYLKKEDIIGISSVVFSNRGEALYLASSSELERLSLSARHITRPTGTVKAVRHPSHEKDGEEGKKGDAADEGASVAATTTTIDTTTSPPTQANDQPADQQKVQTEGAETSKEEKKEKDAGATQPEAASNEKGGEEEEKKGSEEEEKKTEEVRENGDNSVLSGDITIDSIRDHMDELKLAEKGGVSGEASAATVSTTTTSTSGSSVTVVKTTTITAVSSSNQESSSVQVVESTSTEVNHTAVNGTETKKKRAPLAKAESFFSKEPRITNKK